MRIDVSAMTKYIGNTTLKRVEDLLKEKNTPGVEVDVTGVPLREEFAYDIARLKNDYGCKFTGLGEKEEQVNVILGTGYFIKKKLGEVEYGRRFRRLVEMADYPLMIKDNRQKGDELITMNVIQTINFTKSHFNYNEIKPYLLEPGELEKACWVDRENIWERKSTHISDIGEGVSGYRFASSERERTILDILTKIIEGTLTGFHK